MTDRQTTDIMMTIPLVLPRGKNFKKSALSFHIYKDHPQYFSKKLSNYSVGIIKSTSGAGLDRADFLYCVSVKQALWPFALILQFLPLGKTRGIVIIMSVVCLSVVCGHSCEHDNLTNSYPILMKLHRIDP